MLSDALTERIVSIFDTQLELLDKTKHPEVLEFFTMNNYYIIMRRDHLSTIYGSINSNEVLYSLFFDTMPRILFEFSPQELDALIGRLVESFLFWTEPNKSTIGYTADLLRIEETFYDSEFLKTQFKNEKWIVILCLFFLLFHRTNHYKKYYKMFEQSNSSKTSK